jgi:ferredoxin
MTDPSKSIVIQAFHNHQKTFTVACLTGISILELVNRYYSDPKRDGIPSLCCKGVCRSCTIKVIGHPELLKEANKHEQRALGVGPTAIIHGYRLACMCYFKDTSIEP